LCVTERPGCTPGCTCESRTPRGRVSTGFAGLPLPRWQDRLAYHPVTNSNIHDTKIETRG
jgi:hypothetical protein